MKTRLLGAAVLAVLGLLVVPGCVEEPPAPPAERDHVTVWVGDGAYADSLPAIDRWVGYGSFLYQDFPAGGCGPYDGAFATTYDRLDPAVVRVTITFTWTESPNESGNYGCLPNDALNVGLVDAAGVEHAFVVLDRVSHT
jgi:hypothetical protein